MEAYSDLLSSQFTQALAGLLYLAEDFSCTLRVGSVKKVIGGKFKGHSLSLLSFGADLGSFVYFLAFFFLISYGDLFSA